MEDINYYKSRLECTINLFKEHNIDLLQENQDKIITFIEGYNRFKNHPDYDPVLVGCVQNFIL